MNEPKLCENCFGDVYTIKTVKNWELCNRHIVVSHVYLVGSVLQGYWAYPGVHFAVLLYDGLEAASRSPLEDEAKRVEDHTHKLNDVGVI